MATKKLAKRILRRVNGRLTVVYVDVETGQVLQSLDGYELTTHGDTSPSKTESKTPAQATSTDPRFQPKESNTPSPDDYSPEQHEINRNRPMGSGNILKDLPGAIDDLRGDIDGVKGGITGALTNLGARLFGGAIGKGIGEDIGKGIKENGITGAGGAIRDLGDNITNTMGGIGDSIKGGIGGLFGNGDVATAPTTTPKPPNELISYSDTIQTRRIPVSDEYSTKLAAAIQSVDPRITVTITSGGQPAKGGGPFTNAQGETYTDRTGSTRHDIDENGNANTADVKIYLDGELQSPTSNPELFAGVVRAASAVGFTGIGVSENQNFIHIGGGEPAFWGYGPEGGKAKYANPTFAAAYTEGVELNLKGEGERILTAYTAPKIAPVPATRMADAAPVTPPKGVDPKLAEAVMQRKALSKQNVANPALPTAVAEAPVAAPVAPVEAAMAPTVPMSFNPAQTPVPRGFDYTLPAGQSTGNVNVAENALQQPMPQQQPVMDVAQVPKQGFMERGLGGNDKVGGLDILGKEESRHYIDAFLDTVNYAEGEPRENQLFGYGEFNDFSTHPNTPIAYNDGADESTAAGLFQINKPTFDDFAKRTGITGFDKEAQYEMARTIASVRYNNATGRDLAEDLMSGDRTLLEGAYTALKGTWSSLPGGSQEKSVMDDLVSRFEAGVAFKAPSTKDISGTSDRTSAKTSAFAEPTTSFDSVTKTSAPSTFAQRPSDSAKNKPATQSTMSSSLGDRSSGGTIGASTFNKTGTSSNAQTAKTNQKTSNSSGGSFAPKPEVINNPKTNGSSGGFAAPKVSNPDKTNQVTSSNTKTDSKTSNSSKDKNSKTK